jgi:cyclic beta-1,2-glucan synthetase
VLTCPGGALHIRVSNPHGLSTGATTITLNGQPWPDENIAFPADGSTHRVEVVLVPRPAML